MEPAKLSSETEHLPAAEGKAWCARCDAVTPYRLEKVEFLGNPVKATFFCIACDTRVFPEAQDGATARRLIRQSRRLRLRAGAALGGMLALPILAAILAIWLVLRFF